MWIRGLVGSEIALTDSRLLTIGSCLKRGQLPRRRFRSTVPRLGEVGDGGPIWEWPEFGGDSPDFLVRQAGNLVEHLLPRHSNFGCALNQSVEFTLQVIDPRIGVRPWVGQRLAIELTHDVLDFRKLQQTRSRRNE